jgi:DNA repair protein RadC
VPHHAIETTQQAGEVFETLIGKADREEFWVMVLDYENRIIGVQRVFQGTTEHVGGDLRHVVKLAINLAGGRRILTGHNHPGGSPIPSLEDQEMHQKLLVGAHYLGFEYVDSLVIGSVPGCYGSVNQALLEAMEIAQEETTKEERDEEEEKQEAKITRCRFVQKGQEGKQRIKVDSV